MAVHGTRKKLGIMYKDFDPLLSVVKGYNGNDSALEDKSYTDQRLDRSLEKQITSWQVQRSY